ncbi:chemotaxis protein CheW [Magnetospirillum sulfuroxidans]|uniref:Chemotaxis protein CheW n=1 Tax=Magnetospirillum sulfuroxidans TaxID=611300 RepID=A0ABS5I8Z6_9PROT|nr:chemotaxis protein CheW [Magnetospirillum sulfuroxidans]MBR9970789.1 chemotaxis protein CheW [Magnetospirillum sulfuroxidans]
MIASAPAFSMDDPAFVEKVLKARARRLANARREAVAAESGLSVLCFQVAGESYALALDCLAEVLPLVSVSPVPGLPRSLLGVTNVRGEIRPVFNLHHMLTLPEPDANDRFFAVFLRTAGRAVGLRVNELRRIRRLDDATLTFPHESGNGLPQRFIRGISPETLIVLDPQQILAQDVLHDRRADYRRSQ